MIIEENVPLAPYTTFGIGGPARFFVRVESVEGLRESLDFARGQNQRVLILGGGSNVLIDDAGFDGLVIKMELRGIQTQDVVENLEEELEGRNKKILIAGAGESWDALVARGVEEKLWGIENLSGIPGTVGGAVAGNIGAYGQALSQTLEWVEVLDIESGEVRTMSNSECLFDYRDSFFKHDAGRHIILRAAFALSRERNPELSYSDPNRAYKDLARVLQDNPSPSVQDIRAAILSIRADKFPDLAKEGSAGSFFKNPILPEAEVQALAVQYPGLPIFPVPETPGQTKVAIAWLLDHILHMHGAQVGGARLFEKQALVIAAKKNTSSRDVRGLANDVSKKVFEAFGITLEPEVKIIL